MERTYATISYLQIVNHKKMFNLATMLKYVTEQLNFFQYYRTRIKEQHLFATHNYTQTLKTIRIV